VLADALWGERPPATAVKTLQVYVAKLRKLLGKGLIETRPGGYLLHTDPGTVDATRFEELIAAGRDLLSAAEAGAARERLGEALALWRGPPLAEFQYESFARDETRRLEELRLVAQELWLESELSLGHHAEAVPELEALIREHPLRENPRRLLMIALYRSGRQADALDAYQATRATLVDELGIEPSRDLRDLHQQILNQDPVLDLVRAVDRRPDRETPLAAAPPRSEEAARDESEPVRRDARKTVTVLFVSIEVACDSGEQLDPEMLRRVAGRALREAREATERHGGSLETLSGDSLTAVFGLPSAHGDDALRAMRATVELRGALTALASELRAAQAIGLDWRAGVCTGEVIAGVDVSGQGRATGEPLTRSGRIAVSGEVVIDPATYRLVRDRVVAEQVGAAWRLIEIRDVTSQESRLASPMVGRERERRRLSDAFEQALGDRSSQLFTVLGLAGVGKSRLVHELLSDLAGQALVGRGRCLPYGEGITFWPLAEVVTELVGLNGSESSEDALDLLASTLGDAQEAPVTARLVAETIGLVEAAGQVEARFTAVQELFAALARSHPLVVVFDDIHWGEATFLDLVEQLAERVRDVPILLVCLARPELLERRPGWGGGKLNATTTLLEPLSDAECTALIRNLIGSAGIGEEVEERIAEAAEGNPLFVEEALAMLIDDGLLVRRRGRWTATGEIGAVRVPPTIQALLSARLDQLNASERGAIEPAAVIGKVFYEGAVAELVSADTRETVPDALTSLMRKGPDPTGATRTRRAHLRLPPPPHP
jgi:DNA-binding SARP family transcriptional activator